MRARRADVHAQRLSSGTIPISPFSVARVWLPVDGHPTHSGHVSVRAEGIAERCVCRPLGQVRLAFCDKFRTHVGFATRCLYALTQLRCCGTYFGDLVPAYGEKCGLDWLEAQFPDLRGLMVRNPAWAIVPGGKVASKP